MTPGRIALGLVALLLGGCPLPPILFVGDAATDVQVTHEDPVDAYDGAGPDDIVVIDADATGSEDVQDAGARVDVIDAGGPLDVIDAGGPPDVRSDVADAADVTDARDAADVTDVVDGGRRDDAGLILPSGAAPVELALGENFSCSRHSDGTINCWGSGGNGQLGLGRIAGGLPPRRVVGIADATSLAAGPVTACAVRADGSIWCWGSCESGRCGSTNSDVQTVSPVKVQGLPSMTRVALGDRFACGISQASQMWCWGYNNHGQLGRGAADAMAYAPALVTGGIAGWTSVGAGEDHICGTTSSRLYCWGRNDFGQSGTGMVAMPTIVAGFSDAVAVGGGYFHTCALRSSGPVACIGYDQYGRAGQSLSGLILSTPTEIQNLMDADLLAVGNDFGCARRVGVSSVFCWGRNDRGQLADATMTDRTSIGQISGVGSVSALGVARPSGAHVCAIETTGTVKCWGANTYGQLGDGTSSPRTGPVSVRYE